jgi:O-acetylserine/cysteine efflux transporter
MKPHDIALAALTSVIWGIAFVAAKFGLESFSAPQLATMRFVLASLPIVFIPPPQIPWGSIGLIGMTLFAGQFLLLFFAFVEGLPPGLASVTQQMQAFFTVLLAAVCLRDVPTLRQCTGMTVAFAGLGLIGLTMGSDLKPTALGLALAGAFSWAVGNILVKRMPTVPVLPLVVWCSLIPPLPGIIISGVSDQRTLIEALRSASWVSIAAVIYLGMVATLLAYAIWGSLLQRYSAAAVAPFALLAPCAGIASSAVIFGEVFSPTRCAGMALILGGLAVLVIPWRGALARARWARQSPEA